MNSFRSSMPSIGLLAVAAALLVGDLAVRVVRAAPQGGAPRAVIAQEFRLIDAQGNMRASLAMRPDGGPGLVFADKQGKSRAAIGLSDDQSFLALYDTEGHARLRVTLLNDGSVGLTLQDKNQKQRSALRLQADGSPVMTLNDAEGKNRAALATESDGNPALTLSNKEGKGGAALLFTPEGNPVAIFKNKDGKVIWTAPEPEIEIKQ